MVVDRQKTDRLSSLSYNLGQAPEHSFFFLPTYTKIMNDIPWLDKSEKREINIVAW